MSALAELLNRVRSLGIVLSRAGDRLYFDAPAGAMTQQLRVKLVAEKFDLLAVIDAAGNDGPFDVRDPNFAEIVLQWRDRVSKLNTVTLKLPGMPQ